VKILFVCSANKIRSLTAELHFCEKYPEHEFDSAGTNHKKCKQDGTTPLEEYHLIWADLVLVMEDKHRKIINQHSDKKYNKKIHVLGIRDIYDPFEKSLINILEKKCKKFLKTPEVIEMPAQESPVFRPVMRQVEPYILSIGELLIDSESILNSPNISVSMHYHDLEIPRGFMPSERILAAIKYEALRVEMKYDEEVVPELMKLYDPLEPKLNLSILRNNFEVFSIGRVTEVFTSEEYMGFTFLPDYVTNG
jgi:predicted protein tyrosine phosphatase